MLAKSMVSPPPKPVIDVPNAVPENAAGIEHQLVDGAVGEGDRAGSGCAIRCQFEGGALDDGAARIGVVR